MVIPLFQCAVSFPDGFDCLGTRHLQGASTASTAATAATAPTASTARTAATAPTAAAPTAAASTAAASTAAVGVGDSHFQPRDYDFP